MLKLILALILSLFPVPVSDVSPPADCGCGKWNSVEPDLTEQELEDLAKDIDFDKEPLPPTGKCRI
jgi:hypothetical protein